MYMHRSMGHFTGFAGPRECWKADICVGLHGFAGPRPPTCCKRCRRCCLETTCIQSEKTHVHIVPYLLSVNNLAPHFLWGQRQPSHAYKRCPHSVKQGVQFHFASLFCIPFFRSSYPLCQSSYRDGRVHRLLLFVRFSLPRALVACTCFRSQVRCCTCGAPNYPRGLQ